MRNQTTPDTASLIPLRTSVEANIEPPQAPIEEVEKEVFGTEPRYSILRFLLGSSAVLVIAAAAWPFIPRQYESTATIILRPTDHEGQTNLIQSMHQPLDEGYIMSDLDVFYSVALADRIIDTLQLATDEDFNPKPSRLQGFQASVLQSFRDMMPLSWGEALSQYTGKESARTSEGADDGPTAAQLREALWESMVLERSRRSYTLRVGFRSKEPWKATALTETLTAAYLDMQLSRKAESAQAMNNLLLARVQAAQQRVNASSAAMEAFMQQSGLIDEGAQISLEAQLRALATELATARARAIDAKTRADSLTTMKANGTLDSAPEVLASPTIQRLNQSLTESMSRLAVMSTESRNIMQQAEAERDRIVASVRIEADNWAERERLLSDEIDKIRSELVERHKASLRLVQLRHAVDNDAQVLADAQTRMKSHGPAIEALKPDAEILSPATVPEKPVFPKRLIYAAGALFAALLAGAALNAAAIRRDIKWLINT